MLQRIDPRMNNLSDGCGHRTRLAKRSRIFRRCAKTHEPDAENQATSDSAHVDARPMIVCCGFTPRFVGIADASTT